MNLFVEAMPRVLTRRKWPKEIMRTPLGVVIAWMKEEEQNWLEKMVEIGDSFLVDVYGLVNTQQG